MSVLVDLEPTAPTTTGVQLHPHHELYSGHCTLGSVDSLYPHLCTYTLAFCSDPALCSRLSFLYSRLSVLSHWTLTLYSGNCTLALYPRAALSSLSRALYSRAVLLHSTIITVLSTLCTH